MYVQVVSQLCLCKASAISVMSVHTGAIFVMSVCTGAIFVMHV